LHILLLIAPPDRYRASLRDERFRNPKADTAIAASDDRYTIVKIEKRHQKSPDPGEASTQAELREERQALL
jgi:hypothetical protein